jgi:hypothetical protein
MREAFCVVGTQNASLIVCNPALKDAAAASRPPLRLSRERRFEKF